MKHVCDFKASSGVDMDADCVLDVIAPDLPLAVPPRIEVRRMYIRRADMEQCSPAEGRHGCHTVRRTMLSAVDAWLR